MQLFTGAQYLMIDAANAFGLDKETFQPRLDWVKANLDNLESFIMDADEPIMFTKAVAAIRIAQSGAPIGHLVEFDATTSGAQIMSAMTGCLSGATWTNLVDVTKRYDCYSEVFNAMLKKLNGIKCSVTRDQAKNAVMTAFYGSSQEPINEFGDGTKELEAFYFVLQKYLPGAWELRCDLIELWNSYALNHSWPLPDGFLASVNVMQKVKAQVEIDELNHHKFTHIYEVHEGTEKGVSLAANVTHSIDGFIVREMGRRCNYERSTAVAAYQDISDELLRRGIDQMTYVMNKDYVLSLVRMSDPVASFPDNDLVRMYHMLIEVISRPSCELICIHDAFKAHANHMNTVRYWYKELLAELAESDLLSQIFSAISGQPEKYEQVKGGLSKTDMAALIRKSEYGVC